MAYLVQYAPSNNRWWILQDGDPIESCPTQQRAIMNAKTRARSERTSVVWLDRQHNHQGQVDYA